MVIKSNLPGTSSEAWSPQCTSACTCPHVCPCATHTSMSDLSELRGQVLCMPVIPLHLLSTRQYFPVTTTLSSLQTLCFCSSSAFTLRLRTLCCHHLTDSPSENPAFELSQILLGDMGSCKFTRRCKRPAVRDPSPTPHATPTHRTKTRFAISHT